MQIKTNPFGIGKLVRQWAAFFFACLQAWPSNPLSI
jgi:hypothetical protein